jgi:hypothetical protein
MVALQILVPQSVKSRSIKWPYVRGVQTLVTFFCSSSFCLRTIPPLCHSSTPKLIKCSTLYVRESKELRVLSIIRQYPGPWQHAMILWAISKPWGLWLMMLHSPHCCVHLGWQGFKINIECGNWGSWWLASHGMCSTSTFRPVTTKPWTTAITTTMWWWNQLFT